ncbi:hypothetical protein TNCV_1462781 [Trichonephila clavipes]|uniref:Uncharacterized protein n=1 Tax=Trichonephila clavipes TaxID=2585209 RepID=A0A8X6VJW3_TRICX|nr:hypothetical protein TNCV_1462781 [Trichonephila clavipes]
MEVSGHALFPPTYLGRQDDNAPLHSTIVMQRALQSIDMLTWLVRSPELSPIEHIPEGSELANMVTNNTKMVAKLAANMVTKNDANLALPPRFRQILIESPL